MGYQEPHRVPRKSDADEDAEANENVQNNYLDSQRFVAFSGEGNRLDGKKKKCDKPEPVTTPRVSFVHFIKDNSFAS